MELNLFGFKIIGTEEQAAKKEPALVRTFVPKEDDSGAQVRVQSQWGMHTQTVTFDSNAATENQLINTYRSLAMISEVDAAVEDITSECIVVDEYENPVKLNMNNLKLPVSIKKKIEEEFANVLNLMSFRTKGHNIIKRWYIDGRYYLHIMINERDPKEGIKELRYVDPRNLKRVVEIIKDDKHLAEVKDQFPFVTKVGQELTYWVYSDNTKEQKGQASTGNSQSALRIADQAIAWTNSGEVDPNNKMVLSFLHKAIRPANQLKTLEDAQVVNAYTRAPDRLAFYVDTGNLSHTKSNEVVQDVMDRYKSDVSYDPSTGQLREGRRFMPMTQNYFIPRRNGSAATQIDKIEGSGDLLNTEMLSHFQDNLYTALNVPKNRLSPDQAFTFGKTDQISREEAKYARFISRLRLRFSMIFDFLLSTQLSLKGVMSVDEFKQYKQDIHYDFLRDNYFAEMLEQALTRERLQLLEEIEPHINNFFSIEYARKNILRQTDTEIEDLRKQREKEADSEPPLPSDIERQQAMMNLQAEPGENEAFSPKLTDSMIALTEALVRFPDKIPLKFDLDGSVIE